MLYKLFDQVIFPGIIIFIIITAITVAYFFVNLETKYQFNVYDENNNLISQVFSKWRNTEAYYKGDSFVIEGTDIYRVIKMENNYSIKKEEVTRFKNEPEKIKTLATYSIEDLRKSPEREDQ